MLVEQLLEDSADRDSEKTAIVDAGQRYSYGWLDGRANGLASTLRAAGVRHGDRVAVCDTNSVDGLVALFAVLKAGAVVVVINPRARHEHVADLITDSGAAVVIATREAASHVEGVTSHLPGVRAIAACDASTPRATAPVKRHRDSDLAALVYTSGSNGRPKGVMLTHRNLTAAAASICQYLAITADDTILNVLPLAFTYGLGQITTAFRSGATVVLERASGYPRVILDDIIREHVTGLPLVPTIATLILQQGAPQLSSSSLRYITNAGAALPVPKLERLRRRFPKADIFLMYGQTECQRASYLPPQELDAHPSSVGVAIPGTRLWIADETDARVPPGAVGELMVAGPHVMRGYWHQPEATASVLHQDHESGDAVLRTGDLFRMDERGLLYFVDRKDDVIKTRGEKVAPRAVEEVIARLAGISEVSVYGVPDDVLGEAVAASVTVMPGVRLNATLIQRHCRRHLEPFMVPRTIEIRDVLPTTATGKVSRQLARAAALTAQEATR